MNKIAKRKMINDKYQNEFYKTHSCVADVLHLGLNKYPEDNWRRRGLEHQINHINKHWQDFILNTNSIDDVHHMICRLLMISELILQDNQLHYEQKNQDKTNFNL